jgi:hypothetical protein
MSLAWEGRKRSTWRDLGTVLGIAGLTVAGMWGASELVRCLDYYLTGIVTR